MRHLTATLFPVLLLVACGGSNFNNTGSTSDAGSGDDGDASSASDAAANDAASAGAGDAGRGNGDSGVAPDPNDGSPTRQACTNSFGNALTTSHGRLDGFLVAIVALGTHSCNGDSTHVHLQVQMNNAIYDVAVNADTMLAERDIPIPGGAWTEGWHNTPLDYTQLGLHSADFAGVGGTAQLAQKIEAEVASVNHIAVFGTGYGPGGCHLIHRNSGRDGAVVLHPTSPTSHVMFFDFTDTPSF